MIGLRLTSTTISVAAGGTETIEAVVVNDASTVDEIVVDVVGGAAAWSTVTPPSVRLFPGDRASVEIRLHPVLGPQLASGRHDFGVRAHSTTDSSSSVVVEATMLLGAAPMLASTLEPRLARGLSRPCAGRASGVRGRRRLPFAPGEQRPTHRGAIAR
jgi:hypothetical protein